MEKYYSDRMIKNQIVSFDHYLHTGRIPEMDLWKIADRQLTRPCCLNTNLSLSNPIL